MLVVVPIISVTFPKMVSDFVDKNTLSKPTISVTFPNVVSVFVELLFWSPIVKT